MTVASIRKLVHLHWHGPAGETQPGWNSWRNSAGMDQLERLSRAETSWGGSVGQESAVSHETGTRSITFPYIYQSQSQLRVVIDRTHDFRQLAITDVRRSSLAS